ncbi:MAG: S46 family peptidase [Bacteroidota bacterium]
MKKRLLILVLVSMVSLTGFAYDEGMWLPLLLKKYNEADMQAKGFRLTAEDIYDINHSSLKDAVVRLGGGFCTAEVVSEDGLLLTNHHCGFGVVQQHSTVEHDYVTNGFWAYTKEQELDNEGLTASFLVRIEDVTDQVLKQLDDTMSETSRSAKLKTIFDKIQKDATKDTDYTGEVKNMFNGNEYYLFVYHTFKDVRLVGAPPSSIGKFGGDTDNWMWPRHTGDFSMLRIYCGKDGKPATYAKDNVPYHPKKHLNISMGGYQPKDYAMTMGYPARTDRYLTSYGVSMAIDQTAPTIVKIRTKKLAIIKEGMDGDKAVHIKYVAKYASTSNYWKYYIGQRKGLLRLKVEDQKQAEEKEFATWVNSGDAKRKEKYGKVLGDFESLYKDWRTYNLGRQYLNEAIFQGAEILSLAMQCQGLADSLAVKGHKEDNIKEQATKLRKSAAGIYKNYDVMTDKKLLAGLLKMYREDVPKDQQADYLGEIESKYKGDYRKFAEEVFAKSMFCDSVKYFKFLSSPDAKTLNNDPAFKTISAIYKNYTAKYRPIFTSLDQRLEKDNRLLLAGLREMKPTKKFYPNANSTMRVSYGSVLDYNGADAIHYNYYTTLDGIMEKADSTNEEFIVPAKLKALYDKKDYGRYADNGKIRTCFITNNDITGGNSGSPVMNAKGDLIGIAFDGNWEAMSGDIAFDTELKRCINVDIRYVLFIIDKYAGATNLIKEMTLVDEIKN